ncbi:hypothetical protein [Vibrio vulnificus]|nr:hypothetical protein [Vibrio vulnificus]
MTEFEKKILEETQKQTAHLSVIKSIVVVIWVFVAVGTGVMFTL